MMGMSISFRWMLVFLLASMMSYADFLSTKEAKEPKGYLEELEEAFVAKIARERASRRIAAQEQDVQPRIKEDAMGLKSGDKKEVGEDVVEDIKTVCKDSMINFLATNDLIAWDELKSRFEKAKKSIELFELKYKAQLSGAEVQKVVVAKPEEKEEEEEGEKDEDEEEGKPAQMPGVKPKGMPGVKPGTVTGARPSGMSGVRPAAVVMKPGSVTGARPGSVGMRPGNIGARPVGARPAARPAMGGMPIA